MIDCWATLGHKIPRKRYQIVKILGAVKHLKTVTIHWRSTNRKWMFQAKNLSSVITATSGAADQAHSGPTNAGVTESALPDVWTSLIRDPDPWRIRWKARIRRSENLTSVKFAGRRFSLVRRCRYAFNEARALGKPCFDLKIIQWSL